jgi:hypothetical protein
MHFGWKAFRVLLITTNKLRADNVLETIRDSVHAQCAACS